MDINFNPKDTIFSLDIGTRSVIGTVGIVKEKKFVVLAESYVEHQERAMIDGQIHDITLVANAVTYVKSELEEKLKFQLKDVAIAAAGRFLRTVNVKADINIDPEREIDKETIRSLELTSVKKAEERVNKQTEGKLYCVGYSVKGYYLNGFVISNLLFHKGQSISAEVIATFLPRGVVDSLYAVMDKVGLNVVSLTLEPIAAMEAAIPKNLRLLNLVLVDIGAGTSDIAITSKDTISAYGMVPLAGDEATEAIAQAFLVDFNTAERIKRECSVKETVEFKDVLGFENQVNSEEIVKTILPIVEKVAAETAEKIIYLNGGKSPNAVFLVGGGAHTPRIKEFLAEKLNLPIQRIAIKDRSDVVDCVCEDNSLGSTGVTVLGIALVSIKRLGNDFIDVIFNETVISLFNSHKHSVMDVMLQAGINPKILISKNGKNIRFNLNGKPRLSFGTLAKSSVVKVNNKLASIDTELNEGDKIEVEYSRDGESAKPKVIEVIPDFNPVSFYLNNEIINLEPLSMINGKKVNLDETIHEGDDVTIILPKTFQDFKQHFKQYNSSLSYTLLGDQVVDDYIINELDRINAFSNEILVDTVKEPKKTKVIKEKTMEKLKIITTVYVNDKKVELKDKDKYVFIDLFEYIDFDLSKPQGLLVLLLNDNKAGYHDVLNNGDKIVIGWE
ncbi:MAG: rod shape-determining protein [Clostridiaceae bacterium]|nr:rod shape-determining protein [Clostridiaceae bacterium]